MPFRSSHRSSGREGPVTAFPATGLPASAFDYPLPGDRIARYPADRRDESRLLVLPRGGGELRHLRFAQVGDLFREGDLVVLNESRVFPARLVGFKPTGARAEILLLRPAPSPGREGREERWEALVRPGSKLKPGRRVVISPDLEVEVEDSAPGGGRIVRLHSELPVDEAQERYGRVPLPPYLGREEEELDRERYQTVYAREPGSVAAPTAGLHFTSELLESLQSAGVELARIVLHVGVGTFRPVETEDPGEHPMHAERYRIGPEVAEAVRRTRARNGRVWAVGTTVVRALEHAASADGLVAPSHGETDLFIRPPYRFQVVDALLTNFHLPRSTLLMLVSSFGGHEAVMDAYRQAVESGYRFYSYGDAMAVL